jgi:hypothetical protein
MECATFPGQFAVQLIIIQILIHDVLNYPLRVDAADRLLLSASGVVAYAQYLIGRSGFAQHNEASTRAARAVYAACTPLRLVVAHQLQLRQNDPIQGLSGFIRGQVHANELSMWGAIDLPLLAQRAHPPELWEGSNGEFTSYPVDVPVALAEFDLLARFGLEGADRSAVSSCRGNDDDRREARELLSLSQDVASRKDPWTALPDVARRFWAWLSRTHHNLYRALMPILVMTGSTAGLERQQGIFRRKLTPFTIGRMGDALIQGIAVASSNPGIIPILARKLYKHVAPQHWGSSRQPTRKPHSRGPWPRPLLTRTLINCGMMQPMAIRS